MVEARKFKRGCKRDLTGYFYARPDRDIAISELTNHFKNDWNEHQIRQALNNLVRETGAKIEKVALGVWRLPTVELVQPMAKEKDPLEGVYDMTITVIKGNDDGSELVAVDPFTNIWRMVKVG
jgi:hypothetical protein